MGHCSTILQVVLPSPLLFTLSNSEQGGVRSEQVSEEDLLFLASSHSSLQLVLAGSSPRALAASGAQESLRRRGSCSVVVLLIPHHALSLSFSRPDETETDESA